MTGNRGADADTDVVEMERDEMDDTDRLDATGCCGNAGAWIREGPGGAGCAM